MPEFCSCASQIYLLYLTNLPVVPHKSTCSPANWQRGFPPTFSPPPRKPSCLHLQTPQVSPRHLRQVLYISPFSDRLVGLVVKVLASRAEDPGFKSSLRQDFFPSRVISVTSKLALQRLPCQTPGGIGSAPGLVGPVSVYCRLGEVESSICNFYDTVAAGKIV